MTMTTAPQDPVSLWDKTAPPPPDAPAFEGERTCDVTIVGGGFTGLSAALHLAEGGASVTVLEATKIGYGGSGRNAGLVNQGLWYHPGEVVDVLGKEAGERLNEAYASGPKLVFELIDRHGIECEAVRNGTLYLAPNEAHAAKLAKRAAAMNARGSKVEMLDRETTVSRTGTEAYCGALFDPEAGTINPMGYARGLARAAISAGVKVHAESPATSVEPDGARWVVPTPGGKVTADRVILATNAYTGDLWPGLKQEIYPLYYFQFATKPLGENLRRTILPAREGAWDSRDAMRSFRLDAAGRLIVGGVGSIPDNKDTFRKRWAERSIAQLFPHVGPVEWDFRWMGEIAFTPDHVPHLRELAPGVLTCIGYNGRGIGPGSVMGRAMARNILSDGKEDLPLKLSPPRPLSFRGIRSRFIDIGAGIMQIGQMLR